jgi:hypothetical protein
VWGNLCLQSAPQPTRHATRSARTVYLRSRLRHMSHERC